MKISFAVFATPGSGASLDEQINDDRRWYCGDFLSSISWSEIVYRNIAFDGNNHQFSEPKPVSRSRSSNDWVASFFGKYTLKKTQVQRRKSHFT